MLTEMIQAPVKKKQRFNSSMVDVRIHEDFRMENTAATSVK